MSEASEKVNAYEDGCPTSFEMINIDSASIRFGHSVRGGGGAAVLRSIFGFLRERAQQNPAERGAGKSQSAIEINGNECT